jgi:hypothetical protein
MLSALLAALVASASLALACGMSVQPTITQHASDVLAGRGGGALVLKVQGLQAPGLVRVYVDDGSKTPPSGENDPRYVGYAAAESGAAHNVTMVVTGTDALRRALHNGTVHLRFVSESGEAKVKSATLDTSR